MKSASKVGWPAKLPRRAAPGRWGRRAAAGWRRRFQDNQLARKRNCRRHPLDLPGRRRAHAESQSRALFRLDAAFARAGPV